MLNVSGNEDNAPPMNDASKFSSLVDPVAGRLGYALRRASLVMMADLSSELTELALSPVEATVLLVVNANPGCTQADIGRLLGIKRANMVPLIAALASRDLVTKAPVDGRSHALEVTPAGMEMSSAVHGKMDESERHFLDCLSGVEPAEFIDILLRLMRSRAPRD